MTLFFALRSTHERRCTSHDYVTGNPRLTKFAANAGLPVAAVTGLHFAFESGGGTRAVPVRSTLAGPALAIALVVTTLTFGSRLSTLVSHPWPYGWNWNYAVTSSGEIPSKSLALLRSSPDVAGWSGVSFGDVQIDGVTEPALLVSPNTRVSPPILSGHGVRSADQIVLGTATLAQLRKHVGDTEVASYDTKSDYRVYVPPPRQ